ncbi:MAG: hypothetical protein MUE53_07785, partial [Chitinophagales bacterium]|nr:hypothetical protein [Chitinophagales bacterium]
WQIPFNSELAIKSIEEFSLLTRFLGRFEQIHPRVYVDAAHNVAGVKLLHEALNSFKAEKIYLLMGMMADKDITEVCHILDDPRYDFITTNVENPRAIKADDLAKILFSQNPNQAIKVYLNNPQLAYEYGLSVIQNRPNSILVILGSIYLLGEILKFRK